MNGTTTSDFLFPKEIENKIKKKLTIKFIVVLIITNLTVLMAASPTIERTPEEEIKITGSVVSLKLKSHVSLRDGKTPVSLYGANNKLLSPEAFILKRLDSEDQIFSDKSELYEVEIPKDDLEIIMKNPNAQLYAFPRGLNLNTKTTKSGGPYEIIF